MGPNKKSKKHAAAKVQPENEVNDSDDEEIDEDEAFNSDDERKYGSFFASHGDLDNDESDDESSGLEDDDEESENDSDGEGDGGQYMLDLLNRLDDGAGDKTEQSNRQKPNVKESQFASSVISKAGVTLDSLMEGLTDTKGFGSIQKTMKSMAHGHAVSAPLAKVVADRTERKIHTEIQEKDISQWSRAVHENRRAETLDFRPKQASNAMMTRDQMLDQYTPTTDFEKQIHAALQEAGQLDEEAMLQAEEDALKDDLGAHHITLDEFKQRRGQLAKMRALMFYHEQKRHHINKIKSKKYRRIRKKQKEKIQGMELDAQMEENPNVAKELQEKEEMERMKERASLAHKNTSKWAKRVLKRGKNVDVDTRRALSAQLKRGDDLLHRMSSARKGSDDDDDGDEDLVESARKVLVDTEGDSESDDSPRGLFQLSFMKKGIQKQRERARQEARELLMELEADDDFHPDDGDANDVKDQTQSRKKKIKIASQDEMNCVLGKGEMVASSLKFGTSSAVALTGNISLDAGFHTDRNDSTPTVTGHVSEHRATFQESPESHSNLSPVAKNSRKLEKQAQSNPVSSKAIESNPWLPAAQDVEAPAKGESVIHKKLSVAKRTGNRAFVDVDKAVDLLERTAASAAQARPAPSAVDGPTSEKKIATLTQEELVQRAFATQSENEIDEEFAREKALVEQNEDPTRKLKKNEKDLSSSQGWGSWAGQGAPPPTLRKLPKKLQPPEPTNAKRKRADTKKPHVILSEKRVKKTADKFMLSKIPYPFTSREEYERSMTGGVGREWNVTDSFKDMTRPAVITRPGKMIQPISIKAKQQRAPAKF